ncbi:MAG: SirB2 family protein [Gammaproteobacteria bacterium]|nr:SirB2 family protein [Gammaproteobacteria bacterium]
MYLIIKNIHITFATLTIIGFLLRAYWKMNGSNLHQNRAVKIVPHAVDALFLATGIWLIMMLDMNPLQHPWLLAKFVAILAYVGLGMVAFRFGRTPRIRSLAFIGALIAFAFVVGAALVKSPMSWLAFG